MCCLPVGTETHWLTMGAPGLVPAGGAPGCADPQSAWTHVLLSSNIILEGDLQGLVFPMGFLLPGTWGGAWEKPWLSITRANCRR